MGGFRYTTLYLQYIRRLQTQYDTPEYSCSRQTHVCVRLHHRREDDSGEGAGSEGGSDEVVLVQIDQVAVIRVQFRDGARVVEKDLEFMIFPGSSE